jgi:hypothetical protein
LVETFVIAFVMHKRKSFDRNGTQPIIDFDFAFAKQYRAQQGALAFALDYLNLSQFTEPLNEARKSIENDLLAIGKASHYGRRLREFQSIDFGVWNNKVPGESGVNPCNEFGFSRIDRRAHAQLDNCTVGTVNFAVHYNITPSSTVDSWPIRSVNGSRSG